MEHYNHTQEGTLILAIMAAVIVLLVALLIFEPHSIGIGVLGILLLAGWLFSRLTIQVTDEELKWSLGPGWIKKSVPLESVESCETIHYPWYYGYGIHLTPYGWLYNVSGKEAVHVRLKNGRAYLLGTDDPKNLKQAIEIGMQVPRN